MLTEKEKEFAEWLAKEVVKSLKKDDLKVDEDIIVKLLDKIEIKDDQGSTSLVIDCPVCGKLYQECDCENNCSHMVIEGTVLKKANVWKEKIIVPNNITKIDYHAFAYKDSLKNVVLPKTVIEICKGAFEGCSNLESINLHELVLLKKIGESAFQNCKKLKLDNKNLLLLDKLEEIGDCAFWHSGIDEIALNSVKKIGYGAFADCENLEVAFLGKNCVDFKEWVFKDCTKLEQVQLPTKQTEISNEMFSGCTSLSIVSSTENVVKIGDWAFADCSDLYNISLPQLRFIGDHAFSNCVCLYDPFAMDLMLYETVEYIGDYAFWGCDGFTQVGFPTSLKHIGKNAFRACERLSYFFIPRNVITIEEDAFPTSYFHPIKYEVECATKPNGWRINIKNDPSNGVTVKWGCQRPY